MSEAYKNNPILKELRKRKEQAKDTLLTGNRGAISAADLGLAYVMYSERYKTYEEIELMILEKLNQGDDIDD